MQRTYLLIVTAVGEAGTGLLLMLLPSVAFVLLLGVEHASLEMVVVARLFGAALLAIGLACWLGRSDTSRSFPAWVARWGSGLRCGGRCASGVCRVVLEPRRYRVLACRRAACRPGRLVCRLPEEVETTSRSGLRSQMLERRRRACPNRGPIKAPVPWQCPYPCRPSVRARHGRHCHNYLDKPASVTTMYYEVEIAVEAGNCLFTTLAHGRRRE